MNYKNHHSSSKQASYRTRDARRAGIFFIHSAKKAISLAVLLGLFLAFYTSFCTMHLHIAGDGRLYVHYHPIEKTDHGNTRSDHSHKHNDFSFINQFNKLFEKGLSIQPICLAEYKSTEILSAYTNHSILKPAHTRIHTDRAPPAA